VRAPDASAPTRGDGLTATQGATATAELGARAAALELRGIVVRFGGIAALSDVGFEVAPAEVRGLIGPNGAGKTTLFDVVSGVRTPDAGGVHLDGDDITSWSAVRRARAGLRRTFQRVQSFTWLSVADNVLAALEWRGGGGGLLGDLVAVPTRRARERARRERVDEVLELCGLRGLRDEPAGSLPIGQARMVELARAIVDPPRLLLLDEPTSGLEHTEVARLGERIQAIRESEGCAVLLVEHDVGFVMAHCDRIVVLDLGRVLADGPPAAIRSDAAVRAAYLGEEEQLPEQKTTS
jgi:branched-chain amino acid transport system ATP-binding protein